MVEANVLFSASEGGLVIDALVGAVIMVVASTSLLYSIEVFENAFSQSGRYPLNNDEKILLKSVGLSGNVAEKFWQTNLKNAPQQWGQ